MHIQKKEVRLSLFTKDVLLYIDNHITKKINKWIWQSCKIQGQYTNIHYKSPWSSRKQCENDSTILFTNVTNTKELGIILSKEMKIQMKYSSTKTIL